MTTGIPFELGFYGNDTKDAVIDLYDVAYAMMGFQRSLALTTHLILNDEIITQAPSLTGAQILAQTPIEGSWKLPIVITISSAMYAISTAPSNTALGHLVYSAYDYVIQQSLGFHVDFNESLGESLERFRSENNSAPELEEYRFDSLIEKCESSIRDIHRPIAGKETADKARITIGSGGNKIPVGKDFTTETYLYTLDSIRIPESEEIWGRVSSYNSNTFRGRLFIPILGFPIPFELKGSARDISSVSIITNSLVDNARRLEGENEEGIYVIANKVCSKNGRLKKIEINSVSSISQVE